MVSLTSQVNHLKQSAIGGLTLLSSLALLVACTRPGRPHDKGQKPFVVDCMLKTTPVKNQGASPLCWVYGMLATIETEHLMQGDSVNLSPAYVARRVMGERAQACYFGGGRQTVSMRGMAPMLISAIERFGILPYDSYPDTKGLDMGVLGRAVAFSARSIGAAGGGLSAFNAQLTRRLNDSMGFLPLHVFMLGAEYSPVEFAHSVCLPDEYEAYTSFTHHPFNRSFVLEVSDNTERCAFMNVPLNELMRLMTRALSQGHPVCWEGDISEPGFQVGRGTAELPSGSARPSQELRQREFERLETTDDHVMELIGLAHDRQGRRFFIAKNSYGEVGPFGGLMFLSADYVALKTVCIVLPRCAVDSRR